MKRNHIIIISIIVIVAAIFIIFYNFIALNINTINENKEWENEIRPYTDEFLKLLCNDKPEEIYNLYVKGKLFDQKEFQAQFDKLYNYYGKIDSFHYNRYSSSIYKDEYTGFFLYYTLEFETGNTALGIFNIKINKDLNRPYKDYIERFEISGSDSKLNVYIFVNQPIQSY